MRVQDWFEIEELEAGVFAISEPIVTSWLVVGSERALLIDTGMGIGDMRACVATLTDQPVMVVNSHSHWDHIGGGWAFPDVWIHRAEAGELIAGIANADLRRYWADQPLPERLDVTRAIVPPCPQARLLDGGEVFELGGWRLEIIHAPGHSPGGVVLLDQARGVMFSTDVAYPGSLYCQDEDADLATYIVTMSRLAELAPTLRVLYPCHTGLMMAPETLPRMRDALTAVAAERPPDAVNGGVAEHQFAGFGVLVRAPSAIGAAEA